MVMAEKNCPSCGRVVPYDGDSPPENLRCPGCERVWRVSGKRRKESDYASAMLHETETAEEPARDGFFDKPFGSRLGKMLEGTAERAWRNVDTPREDSARGLCVAIAVVLPLAAAASTHD